MKILFLLITITLFSSTVISENFEDELGSEIQGLFDQDEEENNNIFDENYSLSDNEFEKVDSALAFENNESIDFSDFDEKNSETEQVKSMNSTNGVGNDLDFEDGEINESEVFDEERSIASKADSNNKASPEDDDVDGLEATFDISVEKSVSNDDVEEIERKLASEEYKENKDTEGVLKPSDNILNGNLGNKVIVEPRNIIPVSKTSSKMEMVPYRARRTKWGSLWGLSYGLYEPTNYILDGQPIKYEQAKTSSVGLISLEFAFKYNFSIFSAGINTSVGYFQSKIEVENTGYESTLVFIPVKLGIFLEIDSIFSEPYIVPYGHAGIFASQYSEKTDFSSIDGTSFLAYYFTAGLMFQLDWIDDDSSRRAYVDSGIENTFLFAEVNYMSESLTDLDEAASIDPDLSSLYYSAGLKVEF